MTKRGMMLRGDAEFLREQAAKRERWATQQSHYDAHITDRMGVRPIDRQRSMSGGVESRHANQSSEPVPGFSGRHNMMPVDWHGVKRGVPRTPIADTAGVAPGPLTKFVPPLDRAAASIDKAIGESMQRSMDGGARRRTEPLGHGGADAPPNPQLARPPKYRNERTNGYASKREAKRASDLRMLRDAGYISELREQVKYLLIPAQYIDGKCVERACTYTADFVYKQDGALVVEDTKGYPNDRWPIKRKLMLFVHQIRVVEV